MTIDITTIVADVLQLESDVYSSAEAIAANVGPSPTQQIASLQSQLTAAQSEITTLQGNLAAANTTISNLQTKITQAQTDNAKVTADLQ